MNRNRLMLVIAVVAAVVVAAGGFFLGVQPQLDRAAAARSDAAGIRTANDATRAEIARLQEEAKSLPSRRAELARLAASVPSTPDTATFLKQVDATAAAAGVQVSTVTVDDPRAYTPPATSTATADGDTAPTDTATAAPSDGSTPAADATAPAAPEITTNNAITADNFSVIPVAVTVNGTFDQALAFVKGLQSSPRLFLIDSISSAASGDTGAAPDTPSWSFSGSVYVLAEDDAGTGSTTAPSAAATSAPEG